MEPEATTAKQIAEVFRFNKIDGDELHQTFKKLDNALFNPDQEKDQESRVSYRPPRYRFLVSANKLYGKSGFPFVQSFLDDTARFYDSGIEAVDDFTSPSAIKSINDWVSERTEGKINSLLDPGTLDQLTRLLLVNAIYFKAKWSTEFPKRFTREDFFKVRGERERIFADIMRRESMYKFALDIQNECKVLSMYFKETNLTMMIALPDKTDGLPGLESKLSVDLIHSWIEHLRYRTVTVFLPKFKIREQYNLKEALQSMGISDAFDERRADFSGVTGARDLDLSALVHKTFVEINEEGCEAAAVTTHEHLFYMALPDLMIYSNQLSLGPIILSSSSSFMTLQKPFFSLEGLSIPASRKTKTSGGSRGGAP